MRKNIAAALISSASLIVGFGSAYAQTAPASGGIEEVTVTAERREEKLSKVPESISAFTTEKMDQLDVKTFGDLVKYTPGVTYDEDTNNISIRGVNSTAGDATTGIYIDDTPIQIRELGFGSDNGLPDVFDLQRVEVLRGPQGTLFGAGSEGGTIRFITPQPSLTDYSVYAKAELSTTDYGAPSYEGGVAVGGPIVDDKLGFRVSAWWQHEGGYIDQVNYLTGQTMDKNTNRSQTLVVHGSLLWQVTANLTIEPSVFYQDRNKRNDDEYWVGVSDPSSGRYVTETPELMGNHDRFVLPALKADWNLGDAELISNTSYFDRKQTVADYSGTLYDLSYFQQSSTNPDFYDTTQAAPTVPGNPLGTYVDPDGVPCYGGICAANTAAQHANPNFVPAPLLTATGINLPGFGFYKAQNVITNEQKNFTQEVRVQSTDPDARLTWVAGVFYTHQDQLSVEEINDPQLAALTTYLWGDPGNGGCTGTHTGDPLQDVWCEDLLPNGDDYINHTQGHVWQAALFANATYAITPELKLQVGARIAKTHFDFTNYADGAQNFGFTGPDSGKQNGTPFTPMASVTYQFNPDDMIYFTAAKGYRIGGANPLFPVDACTEITEEPLQYNSDTVDSYEAGTKDRFFDGRLQASASVYYLTWNNIQQSVTLPSCGFRFTVNQGTAISKGFDIEGEWLLTDNLDFDFSVGYTDAHYTGLSQIGSPPDNLVVLAEKGDKLAGSPWSVSLGAQYNTNVWDHDAFVRFEYEYTGAETGMTPERDSNTTLYDGGLVPEPTINLFNLRAGATFGNTNVTLFAENLFNAHPQENLNHQDSNTLLFEAETQRPRTIGISASYRY
jgi:outer membrane receptor protein involved in Fe transport